MHPKGYTQAFLFKLILPTKVINKDRNAKKMSNTLSTYIKEMRKQFGLTQVDLAAKSGVGLRFVRELEQGKETLRLDKVNQVLLLFGHEVGPVPIKRD